MPPPEQPRARRYRFTAPIQITDVESGLQFSAQTIDLSLFGCRIEAGKSFPPKTKIRITVVYKSKKFVALGIVAYQLRERGTGVLFTNVGPNDQTILDEWIAELRTT